MSNYLCENCNFNNNGWCKKKAFNGLKKKNIQECDDYKLNIVEVDERDLTLQKMLNTANTRHDKLYDDFLDENSMPNDVLDSAMSLVNLQKGIIDNLLSKIKILEEK